VTLAAGVSSACSALLSTLSPSGALQTVVTVADATNTGLDAALDAFDRIEEQLQAHLANETLMNRLERDFALCVPALADAAVPLETWAIPLLAAFAGPCAPLLSFGLVLACKVAMAALKSWAAKRAAQP
jgi:hypothetical protein